MPVFLPLFSAALPRRSTQDRQSTPGYLLGSSAALLLLSSACDRSAAATSQPDKPVAGVPANQEGTHQAVPLQNAATQSAKAEHPPARPGASGGEAAPNEHVAPAGDVIPRDVPRVYAKSRHVWIRSMPSSAVQWIGYLWWGGTVKIRSEERVPGAGCKKEWVPVEPRGWVCVDGEQATLDPNDPEFVSIYPYRPRVDTPFPHKYAEVHAPLTKYSSLPDEATQKMRELGYERHFEKVLAARQSGSLDAFPDFILPLDPSLPSRPAPSFASVPAGLQESQTKIVGRSALAYVDAYANGERGFLLSSDLGYVPQDRVELLPPSAFEGVQLGPELHLPLAFFRGHARPGFKKNAAGEFVVADEKMFAKHARVQLSDTMEQVGRVKYYKLEGQDVWVSSREAVVPTPSEKTPWGAPIGEEDTTGRARAGRATWIEASILGGWLVAFEGTRPVYATMISAGRGGTPQGDKDPLETASTPTGRFPIGGKFKTATMESSSTPIVHADVPWTQNFSGPYAIHSAYWHDDFGNLKSAGCVNVSPIDGKWLFDFTEPEVPEDWYGVRYMGRYGGGSTLVIIHE